MENLEKECFDLSMDNSMVDNKPPSFSPSSVVLACCCPVCVIGVSRFGDWYGIALAVIQTGTYNYTQAK
jgi:hypothetical protein